MPSGAINLHQRRIRKLEPRVSQDTDVKLFEAILAQLPCILGAQGKYN